MAFAYDLTEFNTSIKPFAISYLFNQGYHKVLYIDPDIFVYNSLDDALSVLDNHSIVVTPHQLSPVSKVERFTPYLKWEQPSLETGIFNLGFVGVSNSDEGRSFVDWWSNRCCYLCYREPESGLFVDQKWVNLAVCLFPSLHILRHKGYNMAAWNLHDRVLLQNMVNGEVPLVFYHFSSIDISNDKIISKHDHTLKLADRPDLQQLFNDYRNGVKGNGWERMRGIPYAYNYFSDGVKIEPIQRKIYAFVAEADFNPFRMTRKQFDDFVRKVGMKRVSRSHGKKSSFGRFIFKAVLKLIYRLFGAKRYSQLVNASKELSLLRNHMFLIE
jgi:hypothetical protein